jgi:hypothetical protein
MRPEMDSGTEFALQALQGQIRSYTDNVNDRMRDLGRRIDKFSDKLDHHASTERSWQDRIEKNVHTALTFGDRLQTLEETVGRHHNIFEQTKGAFWITKVLWVLVGALASTLVWGYATFVAPKDEAPKPKPVPAQVRLGDE